MDVSKVQLANGEVLVDLTEDSVTEETLAEGATAHDKSGARITGTMKSGGGVSVQTDWNQTDETAPDFLKNKPFGDVPTVILEEQELTYVADQDGWVAAVSAPVQVGDLLDIVLDGVVYRVEAGLFSGMVIFGNAGLAGFGINTGEPFFGMYNANTVMFMLENTEATSHTVKISLIAVEKIPAIYYETKKTFYAFVDSGGVLRLYTDGAGTTPATKDQVVLAMKSGLVLINIDFETYIGLSCQYNDNYAKILTLSEEVVFYTVEYTS